MYTTPRNIQTRRNFHWEQMVMLWKLLKNQCSFLSHGPILSVSHFFLNTFFQTILSPLYSLVHGLSTDTISEGSITIPWSWGDLESVTSQKSQNLAEKFNLFFEKFFAPKMIANDSYGLKTCFPSIFRKILFGSDTCKFFKFWLIFGLFVATFEGFPLFWLTVHAPNCAIYVKYTIYTTAVHPQRWRAFRCEHMVMLWKSGENWYFRTLTDFQPLFLPRTRHLHIQICAVREEHHA